MADILYYGAVSKIQTEDILVVEYHFTIAAMPIAVVVKVERSHNDKTYEELLHEALEYAKAHYAMLEQSRGN